MKIKENYKAVPGYEGLYEVSDLGNVRSLNYGRTGKVKVLKAGINGAGYLQVILCKDGKRKHFSVHRLVVTSFIGPIPKGLVINHINENKLDNRLSNLEICTIKENINFGTRNQRIAMANRGRKLSEEHKAKISASEKGNTKARKALTLIDINSCGRYRFNSSYEASDFFGYSGVTKIGGKISNARKLGKNYIVIAGRKYRFFQE